MKKIFKALAITAASAAMCVGVATAAGCVGGNGTYYGEYHYNNWGQYYGMVVEVTVENNIITKVRDITNTENEHAVAAQAQKDKDGNIVKDAEGKIQTNDWHVVSPGWLDYYVDNYDETKPEQYPVKPDIDGWGNVNNAKEIEALQPTLNTHYGWSNAAAANWTDNESYLLQKYEGWSVADILDIQVYIKETGEPYEKDKNNGFNDILISGATQGSSRLLLAVQNALGKTTDIGRIGK